MRTGWRRRIGSLAFGAGVVCGCVGAPVEDDDASAVAVSAHALGSAPDSDCEFASAGGRDYWFCDNERSWQSARTRCQAISLDLAVINSSNKNAFVLSHVTDDSWIGGNDASTEGTWRWVPTGVQFWQGGASGSAVNLQYANWKSGQPANTSNQDCAVIEDGSGNGKWNDESCTGSREYVCEGVVDLCPSDVNKTVPGQCGCGVSDDDSDSDGTADCNDGCDADPDKIAPGACGCGSPDTDADDDGFAACNDQCPNDPERVSPGDCGCGNAPASAGTACDDGQCGANNVCDGVGSCGDPAACGEPDSDCELARWGGAVYWFCDNDREHDEARARCHALGMDLASIESSAEDDFVTEHANEHSFLGGSDQATEGTWRWLSSGTHFWTGDEDGSAAASTYANWDDDEPDDGSEDCMVKSLALDGRWKSHSCSADDAYVCEGVTSPGSDLESCADKVKPRADLTGQARERAYQADLQRFCVSPGDSACLHDLRGRVNLDYTAAAMALAAQLKTPAEFLAVNRDRARKAKSFEDSATRASALCAGDNDGDLIPNSIDACPSTPPLTPTNDVGCTDSTLPPAPPATDVNQVLEHMGYAFNAACTGARMLPKPSMGAFYIPADTARGTYLFAGRVTNQPQGCPVWYVFDIEEVLPSPNPPGWTVENRYRVAYKDDEELTALLSGPVPVPAMAIQFNPLPTDEGTRGQLGSAGGQYSARIRVKVMNGAGMQSPWSPWKLATAADCIPLGFNCGP